MTDYLGLFVKDSSGRPFQGECWPGISAWVDFTDPEAREIWSHYISSSYPSTTGNLHIWNDMNEPSVFKACETTMPKTNLHSNGAEHRDVHNIYGMYLHRASYEGLISRSHAQRPFVLSRAFFAGSHRYGAVWTGDNLSTWDYLKASVTMCVGIAGCGISLCGADIGGFSGQPSAELMCRWYQLGAFLPFFRAHATRKTKKREPWAFGEENTEIIRFAILKRYELLAYWYYLFYRYSQCGSPVIRSMFMQYPEDLDLRKYEMQFQVGEALLVAPVTESGQAVVQVKIPRGRWFDYFNFREVGEGRQDYAVEKLWMPVFVRGGWIVPLMEPRKSSMMMRDGKYSFLVALDEDMKASGSIFNDDGESFGEKGGKALKGEVRFEDRVMRYEVVDGLGWRNYIKHAVVLGLRGKPKIITAKQGELEEHLEFFYREEALFIVFNNISVNSPWIISLSQ